MFAANLPTITAGAPIGAWVNGMLLDPAGLRAVWESGAPVTTAELHQVAEVGLLMADEFTKSGALPKDDNLKFLRENFQELRYPFFAWDFINRPITLNAIAGILERVSESAFKEASGKIAGQLEMRFALTDSAVKRARRILHPKKPVYFEGVLRKSEQEVLLHWADRLRIVGRIEEARKVYRKAGRKMVERGMEMLEYSASSIEKNQKGFSIFQVKMALGCFKAALEVFEKADSSYNILRATKMIDSANAILRERQRAVQDGEPKSTTLTEMFQTVFLREEKPEPDAELIHKARMAAMGDRDAMEEFIKEAADILDLTSAELLAKITRTNKKSWLNRLFDKLPSIVDFDGFFNRYVEDKVEESVLADVDNEILQKLQQLLGKGNDILRHLIPAARRYAEASPQV